MALFLAKLHTQNGTAIVFNTGRELENVKGMYRFPAGITEVPFERENAALERDEWFVIELDQEKRDMMLGDYLAHNAATADLNVLVRADHPNVDALYLALENVTFFTKITPKLRIEVQRWIVLGDGEPHLHEQRDSIQFEAKIDAFVKDERLYFKRYETIKSMFPGVEDFYRLATESEVIGFLQSDFFEIDAGLNAESVGDRNRKKIAEILDAGKNFKDPAIRNQYLDYARQYSPEVVNGDKFAMKTNTDVTKVLHALDERFYTTPFSREKREVYVSKKII